MTFVYFKEISLSIFFLVSVIYISKLSASVFDSDYTMAIAIIGLIVLILLFYKRRNFRKTKIIGKLILEPDFISWSINSEWNKIKIEEINNLKINYNGYLGLHIGKAVSNGDFNRIRFKCKSIDYDYQFDLDSEKALEILTSILNDWYERKIKFKEYKYGQRSFLFKAENSFSEVQKLKERFDIEW